MGNRHSRHRPNQVETAINQHAAAMEAQNRIAQAEAAERGAREAAERARAEHQAAVEAANRAAEQTRREREAEREAANRARAQQEEMMRNIRENAQREKGQQEELARIAREEAERAKKEREAALRASEEAAVRANAEHEAALKAAEEASRQALLVQEEALRTATDEADQARRAEREVMRQLMEGIRPEVWPTPEELRETKRKREYVEGRFHFAVAGISGSGKSSLINAFLGRRNGQSSSAATGVVETTSEIGRYPDPNPERPFIWYDIPGAGTISVSDWQYFNDQGLYIFDCIIVLFDNRFTATDIAILKNCARFRIPTYIVRSKSNQHIRNIALDMGYDEEDSDEETRQEIFKTARSTYIKDTHQSVRQNLQAAGLPQQKVYLVSNAGLHSVISLKSKRGLLIDEEQLVGDILKENESRRCA